MSNLRTSPSGRWILPRIRLVTRGDDAASSRSANSAILEAFQYGILRNASVMAVGPALEHAASLFRGVRGLCVGLHVTLNCEWDAPRWGPVLPLDRVPSLVGKDGCFLPTPQQLQDRGASLQEMMAEIRAQLDRLRAVRLEVAYLDEHMTVGWLPGLTERLAAFAEREGLLNVHRQVQPLPAVDLPGATHAESLIAQLNAAEPGTYLLVGHPTYNDNEARAFRQADQDPVHIAMDRDGERLMFLEPRVLRCCQERGVDPLRYTDLPSATKETGSPTSAVDY